MRPTRREVMSGFTAMVLSPGCVGPRRNDSGDTGLVGADGGPAPAPQRSVEPPAWDAPGEWDPVAFAHGLQVGDVGPDSALLSVWTAESQVKLVLVQAQDGVWIENRVLTGLDGTDGRVQLDIDNLEADTAYTVVAMSADGQRRGAPTRFRTALDADGWRVMTVAATSCLWSNAPWPSMSFAAAEQPDVFLFLGDTVYADHAETLEQYREYWATALGTQGFKDASASTSLIATWDDHEVMNNFEGATAETERTTAALSAFREAFPQRSGPAGTGLWRRLSWGRTAEIFVLDSRGERDGESQYISQAQMDWLKAGLAGSRARFKLIMNSVPITDYSDMLGEALADDRWQGFPEQRTEILSYIEEQSIEGVVWLTGDFHFGCVSRVDPPGGLAENQWEVMVGPGGSFKNIIGDLYETDEQFPVLFAEWNTTMLTLDPGLGTVDIRYLADDGSVLAEMTLNP